MITVLGTALMQPLLALCLHILLVDLILRATCIVIIFWFCTSQAMWSKPSVLMSEVVFTKIAVVDYDLCGYSSRLLYSQSYD